MIRLSMATAVAAALMTIAAAAASEPPPVTAATAVWTEAGEVQLDVTWDGSACEAPGEARVIAASDQTDVVHIPTHSTAEICTMQIVPVEYSGVVAVEPGTQRLAITILDPEGQPKASGHVEIESSEAIVGEDEQGID